MAVSRNTRAFTLIELVVVTAIVGIFAAIAIPRVGGALRQQRLGAAARRVAADLSLAGTKARASSAARNVVFDVRAGAYKIAEETALDRATGTYIVDLSAAPYQVTISSVDFNGTTTASFDGYGKPLCGGTVVLQSDGATRTIKLDADSGKAVIQ